MAKKNSFLREEKIEDISVEAPVEEDAEKPERKPKVRKMVAVVDNCQMLNFREAPDKGNNIKFVLNKGTEVIAENCEASEWYLCEYNGVKAYALKEYITLK